MRVINECVYVLAEDGQKELNHANKSESSFKRREFVEFVSLPLNIDEGHFLSI